MGSPAEIAQGGRPVLIMGNEALGVSLVDVNGASLSGASAGAIRVALFDSAGNALTDDSGRLKVDLYDSAGNAIVTAGGRLSVQVVDSTGANVGAITAAGHRQTDNFDGAGTALVSDSGRLRVGLYDAGGTALVDDSGRLRVGLYDAGGTALTDDSGRLKVGLYDSGGTALLDDSGRLKVGLYDSGGTALVDDSGRLKVSLYSSTGTNLVDVAGQLQVRLYDSGGTGLATSSSCLRVIGKIIESQMGSQPANAATMDWPAVQSDCRNKVLAVVVATQMAWTTSGQPTLQLYVARNSQSAVGANAVLVGSAQNLGSVGTTLAVGTYFFDQGQIAQLGYPYLWVGARIVWPSALNSGALSIFVDDAT